MAGILSGKVTVTTAGTRVQFPSALKRVVGLKIQNDAATSTGLMHIGDSAVSATTGWTLTDATTDVLEWPIPSGMSIKLDDLWADAAADGGVVVFIATLQ
jgi:hypothetical protein